MDPKEALVYEKLDGEALQMPRHQALRDLVINIIENENVIDREKELVDAINDANMETWNLQRIDPNGKMPVLSYHWHDKAHALLNQRKREMEQIRDTERRKDQDAMGGSYNISKKLTRIRSKFRKRKSKSIISRKPKKHQKSRKPKKHQKSRKPKKMRKSKKTRKNRY